MTDDDQSQQERLLKAYMKFFGKGGKDEDAVDAETKGTPADAQQPSTPSTGWERNPLFQAYRKLFKKQEPAADAGKPDLTVEGGPPATDQTPTPHLPGLVDVALAAEAGSIDADGANGDRSPPVDTDQTGAAGAEPAEPLAPYLAKLEELRSYGYDVSSLAPLLEDDLDAFKRAFESFLENVFLSKILSHRIDELRPKMTSGELAYIEEHRGKPEALAEIEWMLTEIEARETAPPEAAAAAPVPTSPAASPAASSPTASSTPDRPDASAEMAREASSAATDEIGGPAGDTKAATRSRATTSSNSDAIHDLAEMAEALIAAQLMQTQGTGAQTAPGAADAAGTGAGRPAPTHPSSAPIDPYSLTPGQSYLIERDRPDDCFSAYADLLASGMIGLCITRTNPKVLRKKFGLSDTRVLWLTDRETATEPTISPELEFLFNELEMFITLHPDGVIVLDGLEYLISNNEFRKIQRFIRELIDEVSEHEGLLLIPVSPYAVETKNLKVLEREMEVC